MINEIELRINHLTNEIDNIKDGFEAYIADTSIPLENRWSTFVSAPTCLRDDVSDIPDFPVLSDWEILMYDGPIHMERHQSMTAIGLIELVEALVEDIKDPDSFSNSFFTRYYEAISLININDIKEFILKHNIGSFTYDW